ncbi:pyruvate ferredoxin oxidoreductase [candidate division WOR-3 bacterium]|uniref:Pyruvate ferredoxin oxidoreductase n=1 Tax=candidate division WOR-3 bacterium TaxID=2052148 RepID=A0A9D5K925_UNCW3|nr:pyruvate ferredoxin oxidoreductase [candidate division WOR-3 bacterium]MBD3364583.1 pyruvate ferredoxin oxidoreductase [candidate division WOR-3 bacterium]
MQKVIMGNHALSWGALLSRAEVIAAYPITPQTEVVELLSNMCADGDLDAQFIKVESEHSAMAASMGASAAGARTFTATSAQGLALMHEVLHWATGARLPIVMGNINRAMAPPWTIWTEQTDSISERDTGWLQIYTSSIQEILDSVIQAYKVAEQVYLPVMVVLDSFVLSHTNENCDIPDQSKVDAYLPKFENAYKLDVNKPAAYGGLTGPDWYYELRYKIQKDTERSLDLFVETGKEFGEMFGREYGLVETYKLDDADTVLVSSASIASTARPVIDAMREEGHKVGLIRVRVFRPFPSDLMRKLLEGRKKVLVVDRNISFGMSGAFYEETKAALYNVKNSPPMWGYIAGLGGRDVPTNVVRDMIEQTMKEDHPSGDIIWIGVKK